MSHIPLIHIGFHKTGTTWLQLRFFTPHYGFFPLATHQQISNTLVAPHDLAFDASRAQAWFAHRSAACPPDKVSVLSSEILVGNPFFGGRDSASLARRLKQVFPQARILITIRAQDKILLSTYAQYISRGGTMTPTQFFSGATDPGYSGFEARHFEYDRLVGLYQSLFGPDNILVAPQESLIAAMQTCCHTIAQFADNRSFGQLQERDMGKAGISYPEHALPLQRRTNHLRVSTLNPNPILSLSKRGGRDLLYRAAGRGLAHPLVAKLVLNKKPVTQTIRTLTPGLYEASNNRLLDMVRHPLELSAYNLSKP